MMIRTAFPLAALTALLAGIQPALAQVPAPTAVPLAASVAARSATEQTQAALAAIRRLDPMVGAVLAVDPTAMQQARMQDRLRRARGPLFGMPILIKDNIETAGPLPTTAGSLALLGNLPGRDAPLVARLRAHGIVVVGKANLSEWANIRSSNSISGWSAVGGQTRNPHYLDRNACGSSSGSAAAVAAGMVPAAIGTETDGSITCPAAITGIVGMKPTVGLVSRSRIVPISASQDTAGPMTRTVRDAAALLAAMAGSDPADPATRDADTHVADFAAGLSDRALEGTRIGVMRFADGFGTDAAFEEALAVLKAQGATLVDIEEFPDRDKIAADEFLVLLTEFKAGLDAYLATTPPAVKTRSLADVIAFNRAHAETEMALFGQDIFEQAQATKGISDPAYRQARANSQRRAGLGIDRLLRTHDLDALVGPTMPPAWLIDAVNGDQVSGGGAGSLAAVAGYPHLTVPMGAVKGLPVGLSFIGPRWSDGRMLSYGYDYEQASRKRRDPAFLPSVEESPPVHRHFLPAGRKLPRATVPAQ